MKKEISWGMKSVMVERVHPYFTASNYFPENIEKAFDDGKKKFITTLQQHIEAIEAITLDDYNKFFGTNII